MHEPPDTPFGICTRARSVLGRARAPRVLVVMRDGGELRGVLSQVSRRNAWIRVDILVVPADLIRRVDYLDGGQVRLDV
jgi:hypothetical protein